MKIKPTQIYGWDSEPVDERPSEFLSTGYSQVSGFYPLSDAVPRPPASTSVFGFKSLMVFAVVLLGVGVYALDKLAPLLRA